MSELEPIRSKALIWLGIFVLRHFFLEGFVSLLSTIVIKRFWCIGLNKSWKGDKRMKNSASLITTRAQQVFVLGKMDHRQQAILRTPSETNSPREALALAYQMLTDKQKIASIWPSIHWGETQRTIGVIVEANTSWYCDFTARFTRKDREPISMKKSLKNMPRETRKPEYISDRPDSSSDQESRMDCTSTS